MSNPGTEWSEAGRGRRHPVTLWSYSAHSTPSSLDVDLETRDVSIVTSDGHLHLLNPDGTPTRPPLALDAGPALDWADTAIGGIVQLGPSRAGWVDRSGTIRWSVDCHTTILDVATAPFGNAVAISFADRHNVVLDSRQNPIGEFTSIRPLQFLRLASHRPIVIGAAETGVICSHSLSGSQRWSEQIWINSGDLATNGNARTLLLAAFNHGLQRFNSRGRAQGFYDIGGTAHLVSVSYIGTVIAAATMENRFLLLDLDGHTLWQAETPEPLVAIHCGPYGEQVVCGFESGLVQCLGWPPWARHKPADPEPSES